MMAADATHASRDGNDRNAPRAPPSGAGTPGEAFIRELRGMIKELNDSKKEEEKIQEEEDTPQRWRDYARDAHARVKRVGAYKLMEVLGISFAYAEALIEILMGMEDNQTKILKAIANPAQKPTPTRTWAAVAASSMRQAGATHAPEPPRHTVRVKIQQTEGKTNPEILKEVKKKIAGAAAVRVLRSGDIDVVVPDQATKDRTMAMAPTEELKVYRRDYLVEVPGVPLTTEVACGRAADNSRLARAIADESRALSPGLQISTIRWLHAQQKERVRPTGAPPKTRGSLIIGFPTQEMQKKAITGGIVIDAQIFDARPFERSLIITQCFKCCDWGHTSVVCGKQAKCGQCAGQHSTRDCKQESTSCANCGQRHRAWERFKCQAFKAYFTAIQTRKYTLYSQRSSRSPAPSPPPLSQGGSPEGWSIIARKRPRDISPPAESQRRPGRPKYTEQAARDPSQMRLDLQRGANSSQESSNLTQQEPSTQMDLSDE
jgi:hypothetical protein